MARFGHQASFRDSVFAAKNMAVQFDYTVFGDNTSFEGAAFECRAFFSRADFGDCACFNALDQVSLRTAAATAATALPERFRDLYLTRANAADPRLFYEIYFSGARFGENAINRYEHESWVDTIRLFFPRLFHSPESRRPGGPVPGASFRGRLLEDACDFSSVRFDQPPDFCNVGQLDNLDLSGSSFSFRGARWPRWRYWTADTEIATRIRRLRKLASDIHAEEAERDLLALTRMVGLGIEQSMWWANVVRPWDLHRMMRAKAVDGTQPERGTARTAWLWRTLISAWSALRGIGRPMVWTALTILYRLLSDFGRSLVLPSLWFLASAMVFGVWYAKYTPLTLSPKIAKTLAIFTVANSIPFANSRKAFDESVAVLFPSGIPMAVHGIELLNGIVSAILLFLVIFAVRNRFRIG